MSAINCAVTAPAWSIERIMCTSIIADTSIPQVAFAVTEIKHAATGAIPKIVLAASKAESDRLARELDLPPMPELPTEGYSIRVSRNHPKTIAVFAGDHVGAMYGGLDIAESIRLRTIDSLQNNDHSPYILRRGIKFNIPLDSRTPSYSDASDSAQQNIAEVWEMEFWKDYLDELARDRFNAMTLWSLHPFPSMVKVPEYPEVALDDVMRTTVTPDDSYSLCGHDMVRPETLENLEVVKAISIDEKIEFWREVMQYAHDRGIEFYVFTWNIFTFGADGKYGITHDQDNPETIKYFRASVREMILTYPLLAGIGITAGERMWPRDDEFDKEKWLWEAYGEGIRDAKKVQPNRHVRMIHRYHQTALDSITDEWEEYPDTFDLSYKYAIAHMYSAPAPPFAKEALAELPSNLRMWMTVRNDDIYSFRWGDPDFARDFIRALPGQDQLAGYYMGPDGYTWGREFLSTEPEDPRQLVIQKQWFSFLLWGRLSYDPTIPNEHFERILSCHFSEVDGSKLYAATKEASKIIPLVTRFHWENLDFQWFPEACTSHHHRYKGYHTVRHFMEGPTMQASGLLSIADYCKDECPEGVPPMEVVSELRGYAEAALELSANIESGENRELRLMLGDIAAMSRLGKYYAAKIEGALNLALFEKTGEAEHQQSALASLEQALQHWHDYVAIATAQYKPQILTRLGMVDFKAITENVKADIGIARTCKNER
jgi:hypothetical protein